MTTTSQPLDLEAFRARMTALDGPRYWRSLEELSEDEDFREYLFEEFPRQAGGMEEGVDRRSFMKLMGASFALAGLAACRAPVERIIPYVEKPEDIIPGKPLFFATAMPLSGVLTGILVESHEGRPTKIEGNPQHPASLGASDAYQQASVLGLYDPDRSDSLRYVGEISTWGNFLTALRQRLDGLRARGLQSGLRILTETITSPSLATQIRTVLAQYPGAVWHQYEPVGSGSGRAGSRLAFGRYADSVYRFDRADVIVALDSDFLSFGPGHLRYARDFADRRRVSGGQTTMNRLYVAESTMSSTGGIADHRLSLASSEIERLARALASTLGVGGAAAATPAAPEHAAWLSALARDLQEHRGRSLIVVGESQPPAVHAIGHAINQLLGNVGSTIVHIGPIEPVPVDQLESLRQLVTDMKGGRVAALLIVSGNPVYTAPADFDFATALSRVPFRAHLSAYYDETSERCDWHIPEAHYLESWGDGRAYDGTVSIIQPLIAPLYNGKSAWELVGAMLNDTRSAHDLIRDYWRAQLGGGESDEGWRRMLHDGFLAGSSLPPIAVSAAVPPADTGTLPATAGLEVVFHADANLYDGRFANNGWLQEVPRPMTKLTWDNVALVSPRTAAALGIENQDVIELRQQGRSLRLPAWVMPGQADKTVSVQLGFGRTRAGRVGSNVGVNTFALRTSNTLHFGRGLEIRKTGENYPLACTQGHFSMEGRNIVRAGSLAQYIAKPDFALTEADHGQHPDLYPDYPYNDYRWAMAIDTSVCVGCGGCIVACQAENNIPVVGKKEVLRQREMHWLRVDRYYEGDPANPKVLSQPVLCMHCEKAPCEPVCPVEATSHSDDGLNEMTYNRCVGTRYCSNNCPYKVRRFNFFGYSDFDTESLKMQRNPHVTVRSRGVMEKCTYCVQRIREGRIEAEKGDRRVRDGEIVTACQASCPTQAIVFGDLNDAASRVSKLKKTPLNYAMLAELNTHPRTTYLATVRNPNPALKTDKA